LEILEIFGIRKEKIRKFSLFRGLGDLPHVSLEIHLKFSEIPKMKKVKRAEKIWKFFSRNEKIFRTRKKVKTNFSKKVANIFNGREKENEKKMAGSRGSERFGNFGNFRIFLRAHRKKSENFTFSRSGRFAACPVRNPFKIFRNFQNEKSETGRKNLEIFIFAEKNSEKISDFFSCENCDFFFAIRNFF